MVGLEVSKPVSYTHLENLPLLVINDDKGGELYATADLSAALNQRDDARSRI